MSFRTNIKLVCDGCAKVLFEKDGILGQDNHKGAFWGLQHDFLRMEEGMTNRRFRRRTAHYCKTCADTAAIEEAARPNPPENK